MTKQIPYSSHYFPPVPVLHVRLHVPDTSQGYGPIKAVMDFGADMTIVPLNWLEQIGAPEMDEVRIRGYWGKRIDVTTYLVDIQIGSVTLPAIEVAGDPYSTEVLLGRNVLNVLVLLLDGPKRVTDVLARRPRRMTHL